MDRGYIYLNKKSFLHNLEVLKNLSRKELCLVVKANAYGHGLEWAVKNAKESGTKWFAVASVDEGIQVKKVYEESRVLLLAEPSKIQLENIKENDIMIICDTGAYGYSLSSNYNLRLRPAEILIKGNKVKIIRKRQKITDII